MQDHDSNAERGIASTNRRQFLTGSLVAVGGVPAVAAGDAPAADADDGERRREEFRDRETFVPSITVPPNVLADAANRYNENRDNWENFDACVVEHIDGLELTWSVPVDLSFPSMLDPDNAP